MKANKERGTSESRQRLFFGNALLAFGLVRSAMAVPDARLHQQLGIAFTAWVRLGLGLVALAAGAYLLQVWRRDRRQRLTTYESRGILQHQLKELAWEIAAVDGVPAVLIDRWIGERVRPALDRLQILAEDGGSVAVDARGRLETAHAALRSARTAALEGDDARAEIRLAAAGEDLLAAAGNLLRMMK